MSNHLCERDAATYLAGETVPISVRTLQRWRQEGIGPIFIKVGRAVRYRREDLDRFLEERKFLSTSEHRVAQRSNG